MSLYLTCDLEEFKVPPLPPVTIPKDTRGYLYIVLYKHDPSIVKVGRTIDMVKRLAGYNTDCPDKPFTVHSVSALLDDAPASEKRVLEHIRQYANPVAYSREWFQSDLTPKLIELITAEQ